MIKLEPAPHPKSKPTSIPDELNRHLSAASRDGVVSTLRFIERGAELVTPEAIEAMLRLLPQFYRKVGTVRTSRRLQHRLELLALYFTEGCADGQLGTLPHREATFALLYFLKGFDRIPDTVPEIGFLDDALIVEQVIQRNATMLRAHWLRYGRAWPHT